MRSSKRAFLALSVACCSFSAATANAQPFWGQYGGNPQHTAQTNGGIQTMREVLWQTPVDLFPPYDGGGLLIHYGCTLIASGGTVVVTVRTGPNSNWPTSGDTFRVEGHNPGTGATVWTEATDYTTPPHDWVPSCGSAIDPNDVLYTPGAGGTVLMRSNADSASATTTRLCFYGLSTYQANQSGFNSNVQVSTPITVDPSGNIYFGFVVTGGWSNSANLSSGLARISSTGVGSFITADSASGDSGDEVAMNCAPALSADGKYVYVAVKQQGSGSYGNPKLLRLNSGTLTTASSVALAGPNNTGGGGTYAYILDDGTPTPMVGPDGDVYYGIWYSNTYRGFMVHFSGDLSAVKTPGAFGWDDTASVVPASCVPGYTGHSSYLILTKYNNYINPGDGLDKVAILDPNGTETYTDAPSGLSYITMKEIMTLLGPTPNSAGGVREWCINTAVIDIANKSAIVNSEDGHSYRWDFTKGGITDNVLLAPPTGEAYTPTVASSDGLAFAVNNAALCCMWDGVKPSSIAFASNTLLGGHPTTGTLTMTGPATGLKSTVLLSTNNPCLQIPASVHLGVGQSAVSFTVTSSAVSSVQMATVTATRYGFTAQNTVTVNPSPLSSFTLSPSSENGGRTLAGTIGLLNNAVGSGDVVSISGGDSSISYPATVTVAAGSRTVKFLLNSSFVSANDTETLTATLGPTSKAASVTLTPCPISGLSFSPSSVVGGRTAAGVIKINGHTGPTAETVTLTGGDSSVSYPVSVSVPALSTGTKFVVATTPVVTSDNETITAALGSVQVSATLTVTPPGVSSLTFKPASLVGGTSSTATIKLSGTAPTGGETVTISGGDSSVSYPATVVVPAGASSKAFTVKTLAVTTSTPETLTATLGSTSASGTLTVNPPGVLMALMGLGSGLASLG